eukprot:scaffold30759_cov36-Prasinocladus_malaysianus.AAC.1
MDETEEREVARGAVGGSEKPKVPVLLRPACSPLEDARRGRSGVLGPDNSTISPQLTEAGALQFLVSPSVFAFWLCEGNGDDPAGCVIVRTTEYIISRITMIESCSHRRRSVSQRYGSTIN